LKAKEAPVSITNLSSLRPPSLCPFSEMQSIPWLNNLEPVNKVSWPGNPHGQIWVIGAMIKPLCQITPSFKKAHNKGASISKFVWHNEKTRGCQLWSPDRMLGDFSRPKNSRIFLMYNLWSSRLYHIIKISIPTQKISSLGYPKIRIIP